MSKFDGSSGQDTANVIATNSLGLQNKYLLPTDTPLEGEVIQALGTTLPDGSRETHWSIIAGVGDVSGPASSINDEIALFNATSGKILKNSSTLLTSLARNPATSNQDMQNFNIENCSKLTADNITINNYALPSTDGNIGDLMTSNGAGVITFAPPSIPYNQSLNTTDNVRFNEITIGSGITSLKLPTSRGGSGEIIRSGGFGETEFTDKIVVGSTSVDISADLICFAQVDINKWSFKTNGRCLQSNFAGTSQGTTNFAEKAARIDLERNANNDIAELRMGRSRGTYASPTVVLNNDVLGEINFRGNDSSGVNNITTAFIEAKCNENWSPSARGSEINFFTTTPGTTTIAERLKINSSGLTVQGNLNYGGTLSGSTIDATTVQFIRATAANPARGLVWATSDDINDGWLLQAQSNSTDLVVKNANLQNVLSATQTGDLTVLNDVSSKTATTSGVKGSTKFGVDEPVVKDVQFFQSAKGGIQETYTRGRGTPVAPVGLLVDDTIHSIGCFTKDATTTEEAYLITATATQNHTPTARGTELVFSTTNDDTTVASEKIKLDTTGVRLNDAYTMPLTVGGVGQILETDGAGQLSWNYRTYGEMGFIGNALETSFTPGTTDEWQIINAVYQQGCVNGFSFQNGNQLVKDGAITRLYRITAGASVTKQLSGAALTRMAIFVNGTEIVRSKQVQSTANTSDFPQHLNSDCIVAVGINDFVEVKIQNGTDDEALTVINLSVVVVEA